MGRTRERGLGVPVGHVGAQLGDHRPLSQAGGVLGLYDARPRGNSRQDTHRLVSRWRRRHLRRGGWRTLWRRAWTMVAGGQAGGGEVRRTGPRPYGWTDFAILARFP